MQKIIFLTLLFTTPLFFYTGTANFFSTPKQLLLFFLLLLTLLDIAITSFSTRKIALSTHKLRFGLLAFSAVVILSMMLHPTNRLEAIIGPGSLYLTLAFLSYRLTTINDKIFKHNLLLAFFSSGVVLALHTLLQLTVLHKASFLPAYMQSRAFTLTGNVFTTELILAITLISSLFLTIKSQLLRNFSYFVAGLTFFALIALGSLLLPEGELALKLLPMSASWSIALDAMKNPRSFFVGIGLTSFPIFYNSVKPLFLNTTAFWNTIPNGSGSQFLEILTTLGVLGFISFLYIVILGLKNHSTDVLTETFKIIAGTTTLALIFTPGSIPLLTILFISLAVASSSDPHTVELPNSLHVAVALITITTLGVFSYYSYKLALAESKIRAAQLALVASDGKSLYENTLTAMQLMPSMTSYRLSYAQVNLSLATALSQKESLTDTERNTITQLISQAVSEAKVAVSLSPNNSLTWQNLGNIYQKLINVGTGADQFALESYAQAVKLDPASPTLRIEYGGLLYQLALAQKEDKAKQSSYLAQAQNEFQTAIQLKPDYANSYYNLAKLLESVGDFNNAYLVLQKAISLLGPDNPNLGKATSELDTIKTKMEKTNPKSSPTESLNNTKEIVPATNVPVSEESTISTPSPLPTPLEGGPVDLRESL